MWSIGDGSGDDNNEVMVRSVNMGSMNRSEMMMATTGCWW